MWDRTELKSRAKAVLKKSYWHAFLVSLVIGIAGGSGFPSFNIKLPGGDNKLQFDSMGQDTIRAIIFIVAVAMIVFIVVSTLRICIGYPLEVGGRRYFIQLAEGSSDMNQLGYGFTKSHYPSIVLTMLWTTVLNSLWYLLLIIPGIVKSYAYSMVPYILAENPTIDRKRAIRLSMAMTRGEKLRIFVLDLSFLGWCILGMLALFVGILFVMPYINATKAELYLVLRRKALAEGLCTGEELGEVASIAMQNPEAEGVYGQE